MSFVSYQTSDVRHLIWNQTSDNMTWQQTSYVRCLISHVCCHITVTRSLMSDFVLCYITVIRRLMSNIRRVITVIWCQTPNNSYMSGVVWYQTNNMRRLITVIWQHTSDVKRLTRVIWQHTSDVKPSDIRCLMSDIRRLIWHQTSYNSYMTADVWCQMSAVI